MTSGPFARTTGCCCAAGAATCTTALGKAGCAATTTGCILTGIPAVPGNVPGATELLRMGAVVVEAMTGGGEVGDAPTITVAGEEDA